MVDSSLRRDRYRLGLYLVFVSIGASGCARAPEKAPAGVSPIFTDVAEAAGITYQHRKPVLDPKLDPIMPWMGSVGAAVAAGDYNRDGWIDLYVTSSRKGELNRLFRNNGVGAADGQVTFTDVALEAGIAEVNGEAGVSMDAVWGDVDNDGWPDLYLVRWGRDALFRNQGDGTFVDLTEARFGRPGGAPGTD